MDERWLVRPDKIAPGNLNALNPVAPTRPGSRSHSCNEMSGYRAVASSAEQHEQQCALLSDWTGVSSSSFRRRPSATTSKSLRSMALSLRLRPRNLSKIRIMASVDDDSTMRAGGRAVFVADQTLRLTMVQFVLRQRAAGGSG
jgi:hypothetical protein